MQAQVAKYVSDELGLINSYDTWHGKKICGIYCIIFTHILGTNNVSKEIKKATQGLVRDRGKVWFPELSDKRKNLLIKLLCLH